MCEARINQCGSFIVLQLDALGLGLVIGVAKRSPFFRRGSFGSFPNTWSFSFGEMSHGIREGKINTKK